jgi:hypothetical protein
LPGHPSGGRAASAQLFSVGAKAGVPISNFLEASPEQSPGDYDPAANRYIIGGTAEIRLPLGFGVEIDALYRHYGYSGGQYYTADKTSAGDWEFPALVKYRLRGKLLRPFVDAGAAVDTLSGLTQTYFLARIDNVNVTITDSDPLELAKRTILGFVAGAGLDLHIWRLHFLPELRYTRWTAALFSSPPPTALASDRNQEEFLLGITF